MTTTKAARKSARLIDENIGPRKRRARRASRRAARQSIQAGNFDIIEKKLTAYDIS